MKKLVVMHQGAYYRGKFEIQGTVIMINHSDQLEDAMRFKNEDEIKEELKNVKNYDYIIKEVDK